MKTTPALLPGLLLSLQAFAGFSLTDSPKPRDFVLCDGKGAATILVETNEDRAVLRAAGDLADDVARVTGGKPALTQKPAGEKNLVIIGTPGQSKVIARLAAEGKLDLAIAGDDAPPQIVSLPVSQSETDRRWQENVLRNAAPTASVQTIATPGLHTLKIWMVDPGIVIDTIIGDSGDAPLGYVWPPETRNIQRKESLFSGKKTCQYYEIQSYDPLYSCRDGIGGNHCRPRLRPDGTGRKS